jgi:hypothetical protein
MSVYFIRYGDLVVFFEALLAVVVLIRLLSTY